MGRRYVIAIFGALVLTATVLAIVGSAGAKQNHRGSRLATPVFGLELSPRQEVPRVTGVKARGVGLLTFDLERDQNGAITAGEVIFYVNYDFSGPVTITGLHVHQGDRGENGPIVVDSGITSVVDADGDGNVTAVVSSVSPAVLQAILDHPKAYYVNLHTSDNPAGVMRDQLSQPRGGIGGFGGK